MFQVKSWNLFKVVIVCVLLNHSVSRGAIWYVSTTGDDSNPGTKISPWGTIQYAINHQDVAPCDTVYLEPGIYYTWKHGTQSGIDPNSYSIIIDKNIYLTSENPNTAIVDGDDPNNPYDGNGSVIIVKTNGASCSISNLTIQNGRAVHPVSPELGEISNILIMENRGGGICVEPYRDNSVQITNCIVQYNFAAYGGGGIFGCNGNITNCSIIYNTSFWKGPHVDAPYSIIHGFGGGLSSCGHEDENFKRSYGIIKNCVISHNTAGFSGGGAYRCASAFIDCTIQHNTFKIVIWTFPGWINPDVQPTIALGGGVSECRYLENCDISFNNDNDTFAGLFLMGMPVDRWAGGGVFMSGFFYDSKVINCTITGNYHASGAGLNFGYGEAINCTISDNHAYRCGGGVGGELGVIRSSIIENNTAGRGGGVNGAVAYDCTIRNNQSFLRDGQHNNADGNGGGIYGGIYRNCIISGNFAENDGGGGYNGSYYNCVISDNNSVGSGGGIYVPTVAINCTVVGNNVGGIHGPDIGSSIVYNSIIWNNSHFDCTGNLDIHHSCFSEAVFPLVNGNFSKTPPFAASGNYRLTMDTDFIDKGVLAPYYCFPYDPDLDGNARIIDHPDSSGDSVDIGAYELQDAVAYWRIDEEDSGYILHDRSGDHDGLLTNDQNPTWCEGKFGYALSFDGVNDYVAIQGYKGISDANSRTVSAWIKPLAAGGDVLSWGVLADGAKWTMRLNEFGNLRVEVGSGYIFGTTVLTNGNWHHIAAVLEDDGSPNVSEVQLFVNGQQESIGGYLSRDVNTLLGSDVMIGVHFGGLRYFTGLIDDVRIYNRALTQDEIINLAESEESLHFGFEAHWAFDEGSGLKIDDSRGNHDASLKAPVLNAELWPSYSLSFDGEGDYVVIPEYKGVTGSGSRTVAAWIRAYSTGSSCNGTGGGIVTWGDFDVSGGLWSLRLQDSGGYPGRLFLSVKDGYIASRQNLADGQWHHVAAVYDSAVSTDVQDVKLYIDGMLETDTDSPFSKPIDTADTFDVEIGRFAQDIYAWYFDGLIDDVRIYDRALTANQISALASMD